jgi:hypothetical protein
MEVEVLEGHGVEVGKMQAGQGFCRGFKRTVVGNASEVGWDVH